MNCARRVDTTLRTLNWLVGWETVCVVAVVQQDNLSGIEICYNTSMYEETITNTCNG